MVRAGTLAFALGAFGAWSVDAVAWPWTAAAVAVATGLGVLLCTRPGPATVILAGVLLGAGWTVVNVQWILADDLNVPPSGEGRETLDVAATVRVASVPEHQPHRTVFEAVPVDAHGEDLPRRIRLSWYGSAPEALQAGTLWRLELRLRPRRGFLNPHGFDYQRWLFIQRIGATGYVREADGDRPVGRRHGIAGLRERLAREIEAALTNSRHAGLVQGLAVGVRDGIDDAQWETLHATGTGHLLAISGLHVGLVAGASALVAGGVWRRVPRLPGRVPVPQVRAWGALTGGAVYALLAGFTLPTQRALAMLTVPVLAVVLRRHVHPWHALAVAAAAVLVIDPLAPLSAGFWLSFGAVTIILLLRCHRSEGRAWWHRWTRMQLLISLALVPVVSWQFNEQPWISPLANAVAIPVVSILVVPATLLGTASSLVGVNGPAGWAWAAAVAVLEMLWPVLEFLEASGARLDAARPLPAPLLWTSAVGAACLLAPIGWPARGLSLPLLLAAVWAAPPEPGRAERVVVFDTGAGLTVWVEPGNGPPWLYGTGPGGGLNGVRVAAEPWWNGEGLEAPSRVVLPRDEARFAGGTDEAERLWPQARVERLKGRNPERGAASLATLRPELGATDGDWQVGLGECASGPCAAVRSPTGSQWDTEAEGAITLYRGDGGGVRVTTERQHRGAVYHRWPSSGARAR